MYVVTCDHHKRVRCGHPTCKLACFTYTREVPPEVTIKCSVLDCGLIDYIELAEWLHNHILLRDTHVNT